VLDDEEKARAFLIADNRTAELGYTDDSLLLAQLEALDDRVGTGYDDDDLDELRATVAALHHLDNPRDPDAVPVAPAEPVSKRGEVYELGEHRLMCGDSTLAKDVDVLMDGESAALLFTSPPYLDLRDYNGEGDLDPGRLAEFFAVWPCDLAAVNLGLIFRDSEIVEHWQTFIAAARAAGLKLLAWNVWNREDATSMAGQRMMFPPWHEWVFVFGEKPRESNRVLPTKNAGKTTTRAQRLPSGEFTPPRTYPVADLKRLGSVLTLPSHKGPSQGDHPAVFPVGLPSAYIEAVTHPGELIVDPFAGSGTTLIAAETDGRRCFSMEIDPRYCDVIRQRYADYVDRPDLAPAGVLS